MKKLLLEYKDYLLICIFAFAAFILSSYLCGYIPVGGGAGWDGALYLKYAKILASGGEVTGDPYRLIRMPMFAPVLLALKFGISDAQAVMFQAFFNAFTLSVAAGLFYATLLNMEVAKKVSVLSVVSLILTWPFIVMPMYYPILTDHAALAISCLCMWCWSKSIKWILYLISAISLWVVPGFFLIPLILSAFPFGEQKATGFKFMTPICICIGIFFCIFVLFLALPYSLDIPKNEILAHASHSGGVTAVIELRFLSLAGMAITAVYMGWVYARFISSAVLWKSINLRILSFSLLAFLASAYFMYNYVDWSSGFVGPPLVLNILMQSMALPLKPLVSHFVSLTPVIFLVFATIAKSTLGGERGIPLGLLIIVCAFMPFLFLGSESRQWIGVLPVLIAIFAMATYSVAQRIWVLIFSTFLIAPVVWLNQKTLYAINSGLSFQTIEWQLYFGRQGPWMSVESYSYAVVLLVIYSFVHLLLSNSWRTNIGNE